MLWPERLFVDRERTLQKRFCVNVAPFFLVEFREVAEALREVGML
jgi:hypothetical protein